MVQLGCVQQLHATKLHRVTVPLRNNSLYIVKGKYRQINKLGSIQYSFVYTMLLQKQCITLVEALAHSKTVNAVIRAKNSCSTILNNYIRDLEKVAYVRLTSMNNKGEVVLRSCSN